MLAKLMLYLKHNASSVCFSYIYLYGMKSSFLLILVLIWSFCLQLDRQTLSIAVRFLKAKTPEQRAAVDLDTHYSKVDWLFI